MLKTINLIPLFRDANLIPQHKRNLNDAGQSSGHEGISKDGMDHGRQRKVLRMRRHGITRQQDDQSRDDISLGSAIPRPTEPEPHKPRTPPDDAHGGMLNVIASPGLTPSMFRKRVDHAPGRDEGRVEEFLGSARATQPELTDLQDDGQEDPIPDEGAAHDEMGQTLAEMIGPAEAECRDATKEHLYPSNDR